MLFRSMAIGFGREKCAKVLHKSRQFPAKMSVTGELKLAIYALSDLPSVMTTSPLPTPPLHSFSKLPLDLVELLQAERFALTKFVASKSLVFDAGRRAEATEPLVATTFMIKTRQLPGSQCV